MRLLCTGDLHLGAGADLGRQPGDRLRDQEQVWARILELAVDESVDGILFAGDAFEGPTPTSEHYEAFLRPIERVLQARIPMLAVSGNGRHDSAMRSTNALQIFDGYGLTVSSSPDVYKFCGCAVATLPWVSPARLVAARNGGDRDEIHADVAQLLVEIAARGLEDCRRVAPHGAPAVLLAHWSVSGSSLPNGLPVDQLREPVIPLADLEALGFDAIVLGHIHQPQLLATDLQEPEIPIFYVGSPLPLNFGEAQSGHGVRILELGEQGWQRIPQFFPIESRPLVTIDLADIEQWTTDATAEPLPLEIADGAIVRVRYTATSEQQRRLDVAEMRQTFIDAGAALVRVQPEIVRADRARVEGLDEGVDELQALDQWIATVEIDSPLADGMRARTRSYLEAAA